MSINPLFQEPAASPQVANIRVALEPKARDPMEPKQPPLAQEVTPYQKTFGDKLERCVLCTWLWEPLCGCHCADVGHEPRKSGYIYDTPNSKGTYTYSPGGP